MKNEAAQKLGALGGAKRSEAKTVAARKNASKPRGKWMTAIHFGYISARDGEERHGVALIKGKGPSNAEKFYDWCIAAIFEQPIHAAHFRPGGEITHMGSISKQI